MNKKYLTVLAAFITLLFPLSFEVSAVPRVSLTNAILNTPDENVFRIEGCDLDFILLDVTEDNNSKFFVMIKNYIGKKAFDTTKSPVFSTTDISNVGYYLNNTFLNNGATVGKKVFQIPIKMRKYIDVNHVWETEGCFYNGQLTNKYSFTAGLTLLSQTEYDHYKDKIGIEDYGFSKFLLTDNWFLRTGSDTSQIMYAIKLSEPTTVGTYAPELELPIRPVFYLNRNVFKNCKVVTHGIGDNVKKAIKNIYSVDELNKLYNNVELWDVFGYQSKYQVSVQSVKAVDNNNVMLTIDVKNMTGDSIDGILNCVLYNQNGLAISSNAAVVNIKSNSIITESMSLDISEYREGMYLKTYIWDNNGYCKQISNSAKIYNLSKYNDDYK